MSIDREKDPDGVDEAPSTEVHENTRTSAEGVEEQADTTEGRDAAAGLIGGGASGKGEMTDPRYITTR